MLVITDNMAGKLSLRTRAVILSWPVVLFKDKPLITFPTSCSVTAWNWKSSGHSSCFHVAGANVMADLKSCSLAMQAQAQPKMQSQEHLFYRENGPYAGIGTRASTCAMIQIFLFLVLMLALWSVFTWHKSLVLASLVKTRLNSFLVS